MAKTRKKEKVKLTRRMVNEVSFEHLQAVRSLEKVKNYDRVFAEIAATRRLGSLHALGYKKSSGKPCIHRLLGHKICLRSDVRADGCWASCSRSRNVVVAGRQAGDVGVSAVRSSVRGLGGDGRVCRRERAPSVHRCRVVVALCQRDTRRGSDQER